MAGNDFKDVSSAALNSIESLLLQWLPNGVREGNEYCVGSRHGEAGRSLKIRILGDKAGVWSDFAEGGTGSDLISLYVYLNGVAPVEAMKAIAADLGMNVVSPARVRTAPAQAQSRGISTSEKKPRTEWQPILPVPEGSPPPPAAHVIRGKPTAAWGYINQVGQLLGMVYRFVRSDGGKEVLPCVFARHPVTGAAEWRWISFPDPRPLYLASPLRPDKKVLIVEGEKCADAAFAMLGSRADVVSWPGGGKAVGKVDWSPLAGKRVVIWPDCDSKREQRTPDEIAAGVLAESKPFKPEEKQPGIAAAENIASQLVKLGCEVKIMTIPAPGTILDGWDIVDAINEGYSVDRILALMQSLRDPACLVEQKDKEIKSTPRSAGASPVLGWMTNLIYKKSNGQLEDCRENVMMILVHDPLLAGVIGLNEFSMLQMKCKSPPWGGDLGEWNEGDDFELGSYLAQNYQLVIKSDSAIEKAVAHAARINRFNPVTDYLSSLRWDGVNRLDSWISEVMGAPTNQYHSLVGRLFLLSMVARAFQPGCQMDTAPVFEGGQGEGKSSAMRILGGDWYSETPFKIGDKDGYLAIQGIWLYEIAELDSFNRAETTGIKAFMSNLNDRFRAPYGRRMINAPRRTCFTGTTNQDEYFKDTTGNRRFLPVSCGSINLSLLRDIRDQLFAEAVHLFSAGERWYPTKEETRNLIEPEQEKRELEDVWKPRLFRYVEGISETEDRIPRMRLTEVTAEELLTKALHIEIGKISAAKGETMRIGVIMKKMGWTKKRRSSGARDWYYQRKDDDVAV